jgi:hypothetical protein
MVRRWVSLIAFVALAGCVAVAGPTGSSASSLGAVKQGIPSEAPSIAGVITEIDRSRRVRVEDSESGKKAVVRITDETRILDRNREARSDAALSVGQAVRVWFVGPVAESYPVQATAGVLVIDQ